MNTKSIILPNKVTVIGLGASGLSAARYLAARDVAVTVVDGGNPSLAHALPDGVACDFGHICADILLDSELIVISPGVNPLHDSIIKARKAGIPIVSDVQLFINECHARGIAIIAITGSNAKSTVTTLVGQMAQDAGMAVGVGGNLGTPALDLLADDIQLAVLELSSFQLEAITQLNAQAVTILNLSEDHLDRHGDMAGYLAAKLPILQGAQVAIINHHDQVLKAACLDYVVHHAKDSRILTVATAIEGGESADFRLIKDDEGIFLAKGNQKLIDSQSLKIKGVHNLTNALFCLALGESAGLSMAGMIETLRQFGGLAHRCEFVATVGAQDYFNDSKGTNVGATEAAIVGLGEVYGERSLAVILGGQGKGQNFMPLAALLNRYAHSVYLIGEDKPKIEQHLQAGGMTIPMTASDVLETAVRQASQSMARAVLLSPACASFDQFEGFVHRGQEFVRLVGVLAD